MSTYHELLHSRSMYYKPTLFRADIRKIVHGLIIRSIQYYSVYNSKVELLIVQQKFHIWSSSGSLLC